MEFKLLATLCLTGLIFIGTIASCEIHTTRVKLQAVQSGVDPMKVKMVFGVMNDSEEMALILQECK